VKKGPQRYFLLLLLFFSSTFLLFPVFHHERLIIVYSIAYIVTSILFVGISVFILRYDVPSKYVIGLVALGVVLRLAMIPIHPSGSDDYYRYVWDGKVMANGINPYRYAPDDPALARLHTDVLPSRVNFPDMKTIYPPVAEIIFYISYIIGGDNYVSVKLILFVFDLLSMFGIYQVLKKTGLDRKNILLYALCPLPMFQFFVDAHVDGFGLPLLVFALLFYVDGKKALSYLFVGLSICVKPLGLILIPIMFLNERSLAERIKSVAIPALVCLALYVPFMFSGTPFQALMKFTENWTFNGVVFDILDSFIHDNQRSRLACAALLFVFYLPVILSRKDFLTKVYLSVFMLFIFSPVVHPWYLSWLAIILPLIPRWSGITYVGLVSLTAFTILNYQLTGVWKEYPAAVLAEYIPVLALFAYEFVRSERHPANRQT